MDIFLVYLFDTEGEVDKVTVCRNKDELSDLLLNIDDRYELIKIDIVNSELEEDYRVFKNIFDNFKKETN